MIDRRVFLKSATAGAALALSGCGAPDIRDSFYRPTPSAPLTPQGRWYINAYSGTRTLDGSSWRLQVQGDIGREMTLDRAALARYRERRVRMTMMCVGNAPGGYLMSSGEFSGVRLADVLGDARLRETARSLLLVGADGFPTLLERDDALADDALLVHSLNGDPLAPEHGYPLRLVRPGRFGFRQPKWVVGMRALRRAPTVRVVSHALDGIVADHIGVVSRIDLPVSGSSVAAGTVELSGVAYSGRAGIARVELSLDGGAWQPVAPSYNGAGAAQVSTLWTLWRGELALPRGQHRVAVRAVDTLGRTQPTDYPFPYSSDSRHAIALLAE